MPIISASRSSDALGQLLGAGGEESVGRALEEQERRPRFELGILREQLLIARLELGEVIAFLVGELARTRVRPRASFGHARGARVELAAAALGGDGDPQRVAREQQLGGPAVRPPARVRCGTARTCRRSARTLCRAREVARRGHLFDERLDVGAEELDGAVAGLADQMEVPRMTVGVLETEAALRRSRPCARCRRRPSTAACDRWSRG